MAGSLRAGESLLRRSHDADRRIHASTLMLAGCRVPGNHEQVVPERSRGGAIPLPIGSRTDDCRWDQGHPEVKFLGGGGR